MSEALLFPELTWNQWGAILIPLYILLGLWMRWCLTRVRNPRPTKGAKHGNTR